LSCIVVETVSQLEQTNDRAHVASERLLAQHHQGTFLCRSRPLAAALLHFDRYCKCALDVGLEIAEAFAAHGRVAGLAGTKLAVLGGLAVAYVVAVPAVVLCADSLGH